MLDYRIWKLIWKLRGSWSKGFDQIDCKNLSNSIIWYFYFFGWISVFSPVIHPSLKVSKCSPIKLLFRENKQKRRKMVWWNTWACFAQIIHQGKWKRSLKKLGPLGSVLHHLFSSRLLQSLNELPKKWRKRSV